MNLKPHSARFWYELGVNPNDIQTDLARNQEDAIDRLRRSSLMSRIVTKTMTKLTGYDDLGDLAEEKPPLFVEMWCLWKFYNNRRRVYLITDYVSELEDRVRSNFLANPSSQRDSFNCLLVASVFKEDLLKRFLLMDGVDIRSFQKLRLKSGKDGVSSFRPMNRARIETIASSLIDDFETRRKEQKESTIERVLSENSEVFLFVRRQIKEEIITQAKDSIVVKPAERIVVQFLSGGREVNVSARTKKTALDFVELFAGKAWGSGLAMNESNL